MHIRRVQVEEGFLDGLDLTLVPGLDVLIGARGTGKTSLIELIRFCLGVTNHAPGISKRSREHALSVLGSGQVTITLQDGSQTITVSRTAADDEPRASGPLAAPIIFSQTEIETVGLQPSGRLELLDGLVGDRHRDKPAEIEGASAVRSLTAEAESLRREIDDLDNQIAGLVEVEQQLMDLAPKEQELTKLSADSAKKKKELDALSESISSNSVAAAAIERFQQGIAKWHTLLVSASNATPAIEMWPRDVGDDVLATARDRVNRARTHVEGALHELELGNAEARESAAALYTERVPIEEGARQLRKEIELLQTGAGALARQGQQLREQKARLESLRTVSAERSLRLKELIKRRDEALDRLDAIKDARFKARNEGATRLNAVLGPKIRIEVSRAGQFSSFAAAIAEALRGSGMRYGDLAVVLAEKVSPRELVEAVDTNDADRPPRLRLDA